MMTASGQAPVGAGPALRDIHLPGDPSWWPPAPGWWMLALLLVAAHLVLVRRRERYLDLSRSHCDPSMLAARRVAI